MEMPNQSINSYNSFNPVFLVKKYCCKNDISSAVKILKTMDGVNGKIYNIAISHLIKPLLKNRMDHELENIIVKLHEKNIKISIENYTQIIKIYFELGSVNAALNIFTTLQSKGPPPNTITYTTLINGYCKMGDLKNAVALFEKMGINNSPAPNAYTYTTLINGYCKMGDLKNAVAIFNKMGINKRPAPNVFAYNCLIKGHCQHGDIEEAIALFEKMRTNKKTVPDLFTYNSLIEGYCKHGRIKEAVNLFQKMGDNDKLFPNLITYTMLINGYCKYGAIEEAVALFEKMRINNLTPDVVTYTTLIDGYCQYGDIEGAVNLFKRMGDKENPAPNVASYNTLINGYCKHGRIKDAVALFEEMGRNHNVAPDVITYTTLINGYCQNKDIERAINLFRKIETHINKSSMPDVTSYNALINGYCKHGRIEDAIALFEKMGRNHHPFPDRITYTTLIDGYCKHGRIEEAIDLFKKMRNNNLVPSVTDYNSLIDGYCKHGRMQEAIDLFKRLGSDGFPNSDIFTYNSMIDSYCKYGDVKSAASLFNEMELSNNPSPDRFTYNSLINGYCKYGGIEDAVVLFERMKNNHRLTPNVISYNSLIDGYCKHGWMKEAVALFEEMKQNNDPVPDVASYNSLIDGYCKHGWMKEAVALFEEMKKNNNPAPDVCTYNSLIDSYCKTDRADIATVLFKELKQSSLLPDCATFHSLLTGYCAAGEWSKAQTLYEEEVSPTIWSQDPFIKRLRHQMNREAPNHHPAGCIDQPIVKSEETAYYGIVDPKYLGLHRLRNSSITANNELKQLKQVPQIKLQFLSQLEPQRTKISSIHFTKGNFLRAFLYSFDREETIRTTALEGGCTFIRVGRGENGLVPHHDDVKRGRVILLVTQSDLHGKEPWSWVGSRRDVLYIDSLKTCPKELLHAPYPRRLAAIECALQLGLKDLLLADDNIQTFYASEPLIGQKALNWDGMYDLYRKAGHAAQSIIVSTKTVSTGFQKKQCIDHSLHINKNRLGAKLDWIYLDPSLTMQGLLDFAMPHFNLWGENYWFALSVEQLLSKSSSLTAEDAFASIARSSIVIERSSRYRNARKLGGASALDWLTIKLEECSEGIRPLVSRLQEHITQSYRHWELCNFTKTTPLATIAQGQADYRTSSAVMDITTTNDVSPKPILPTPQRMTFTTTSSIPSPTIAPTMPFIFRKLLAGTFDEIIQRWKSQDSFFDDEQATTFTAIQTFLRDRNVPPFINITTPKGKETIFALMALAYMQIKEMENRDLLIMYATAEERASGLKMIKEVANKLGIASIAIVRLGERSRLAKKEAIYLACPNDVREIVNHRSAPSPLFGLILIDKQEMIEQSLVDQLANASMVATIVFSTSRVHHPSLLANSIAATIALCEKGSVPLHKAQREALTQIQTFLHPRESALPPSVNVMMATGAGKTRVFSLAALAYLQAKMMQACHVLIICPRLQLIEQSVEELEMVMKQLGIARKCIIEFHSGGTHALRSHQLDQRNLRSAKEGYIYVSCVKSVRQMMEKDPTVRSLFGLILLDEYHTIEQSLIDELSLNNRSKIPIIGFSATGRAKLCGHTIYQYGLNQALKDRLITPWKIATVYPPTRKTRAESLLKIVERLAHHPGMIIARNTKEADAIEVTFNEQSIPSRAVHSFKGTHANQQAIDLFRCRRITVLVTVDMLQEGSNLPQLRWAMIAKKVSPDRVIQILGRIVRLDPTTPSKEAHLLIAEEDSSPPHWLPKDTTSNRKLAVKATRPSHDGEELPSIKRHCSKMAP